MPSSAPALVCYRRGAPRCFTIDPTGAVNAAAASTFDAELGACVEALAAKWRFPASDQPSGSPVSIDVTASLVVDAL